MREFVEKINSSQNIDGSVTLDLQQRVKSRLKTCSDSGEKIGIFMERGNVLEHGDLIIDKDGYVLKVVAALETISSIYSDDPLLLARACYHLGNRHVELQIKETSVHYIHDHVLDKMIQSFGLDVIIESLPFQPEKGAYNSHGTTKLHSHEH
ncbi:MAG: urease accessory protein UreE [Gammaproteobacteria bacterium]|nr:urease accessory protein UreE [Gammaproteobacteria bacterium]